MKKSLLFCIMMLVALLPAVASTNNRLGDANCDGNVGIGDVSSLIDHLLGQDSGTFSSVNADTNRDGSISIGDVVMLIDYLLGVVDLNMTETFTVNGVQFTMVKVEGGTFTMGATAEQSDANDEYENTDNELPTHQVTLSTYSIGQTEVTQELWQAVMGSNHCWFMDHSLQCPMERVTWDECQDFIARLNTLTGRKFRLPTEAEWEFAARGGNLSRGYKFAGSNTLDEVGWYVENDSIPHGVSSYDAPRSAVQKKELPIAGSDEMGGTAIKAPAFWNPFLIGTIPVASKQPNELGLYDMSGNVWEWCMDRYDNYSSAAQTNPLGFSTGEKHVIRGGSCEDSDFRCRVSYRSSFPYHSGICVLGLRLALDEENTPKFHTSETVLQVLIGESKTVNILNGHGDYSIACEDNHIFKTLNGERLTVTGKGQGTTTVHVTDNATGETTAFTVIVYIDGEIFSTNTPLFRMIRVEGGTFTMGATAEQADDCREDELPVHQVTLSSFYIGETEVPQYLWSSFMIINPSRFHYNPPEEMPMRDSNSEYNNVDYSYLFDRPVEQVSWNDCQLFIAKLNKRTGRRFRLPTEAEWEFAARGGNLSRGYKYAGSDSISDVTGWEFATDIIPWGACNELGLNRMSGNVREWCQDWYGSYSSTAQTDPMGPVTGSSRVVRGGCWNGEHSDYRVSSRDCQQPDYVENNLGLRLVLEMDDNPNFHLSETVIEVEQGHSETINILNGNGNYSYSVADGADHISVALSGNTLNVAAITAGVATIYVTDVATGASTTLVVAVPESMPMEETFTVNGVSFKMNPIAGSVFSMGSNYEHEINASENESPIHLVKLSNYSIGETEVTQALWVAVMGSNPSYFLGDLKRPVENVSWYDCQLFIAKLNELTGRNFRLPTEAEWEFAARGGLASNDYDYGFTYSGSNRIQDVAWYYDNSYAVGMGDPNYGTHPVATKYCNLMGTFDMSGNVWEWCQDWYGSYTSETQVNPTGPETGSYRVMRGGSWCNSAKYNRVSCRNYSYPGYAEYHVGFRLAL